MEIIGKSRWRRVLCGGSLCEDLYKPKNKAAYKRYIFKCAHHTSCYKKTTFARISAHGRVEPLAFLHFWHILGSDMEITPDARAHNAMAPSKEELRACFEEHGVAFEASYFDP